MLPANWVALARRQLAVHHPLFIAVSTLLKFIIHLDDPVYIKVAGVKQKANHRAAIIHLAVCRNYHPRLFAMSRFESSEQPSGLFRHLSISTALVRIPTGVQKHAKGTKQSLGKPGKCFHHFKVLAFAGQVGVLFRHAAWR